MFCQVHGDLATKLTELARQQSSDEEEEGEEEVDQCEFPLRVLSRYENTQLTIQAIFVVVSCM